MGGKGSGHRTAYPGANLAKGWIENNERDLATWDAGQKMLKLIDLAFIHFSRRQLQKLTIWLARIALNNLSLEEIRAQNIQLTEDLGL